LRKKNIYHQKRVRSDIDSLRYIQYLAQREIDNK